MCFLSFLTISFYIRGRRDGKTVAPRKPVEKTIRETPSPKAESLTANKWHPKEMDVLSSKPINIFRYKLAVSVQQEVFQSMRLEQENPLRKKGFGGCILVFAGRFQDSWFQKLIKWYSPENKHIPRKLMVRRWFSFWGHFGGMLWKETHKSMYTV